MEYFLEVEERQLRDSLLLGGVPLCSAKQIVHVDVNVLHLVGGRLGGGRSVIGLGCWGVDCGGRDRV